MRKKLFGRVFTMLLAISIFMSTTAFATTTYYIDVTLTGPDANGVVQTVTGKSSKYGSLSSPLAYEVAQVINSKLDTIETVYARTGLREVVYDGLEAFTAGEDSWDAYGDIYTNDVTGDFKKTLQNLDSTFADLTVNEVNTISYLSQEDDVYVVTITLREYEPGIGDGECRRDKNCPAIYLTDLDLFAWYHDGIHYCVENGVMEGYPQNLFGPNDNLTRAQVAQILYNLEKKPAVDAKKIFNDVEVSAWYANAITWAADTGIALGYGDNTFGPEDPITREQLAAMLYRYSEYKKYDVSAGEDLDFLIFTDADIVSDWALRAIKWVFTADIIDGVGNGRLDPTGLATRAQAATVFMRYCLNIPA